MINFFNKHERLIIRLLVVFSVLAAVKSIFTDTGYDNSYMVAMSYRHLNGDNMFHYMWEPHQTSIYVNDVLMWIYHLFVPSYTGVMLYLQICGTVILGIVAKAIYDVLRKVTDSNIALTAALFFFVFRAKQSPFPDYSNLLICFSALSFVFLVKFFEAGGRYFYLFLSAVFFCMETLAYPSGILTFIPIVVLLICYAENKGKAVGLFVGVCGVTGGLYCLLFVVKLGLGDFLDSIKHIIFSDTHQTGEMYGSGGYFNNMGYVLGWLGISALVAFVFYLLINKILKKNIQYMPLLGIILMLTETVMLFLQKKLGVDWTINYFIIPIVLVVLGGSLGYNRMTQQEKRIWFSGVSVSLSAFFAALFLSDLCFLTIAAYLVLGGVVSFIPLKYAKDQILIFMVAVCALAVIHRGLLVWGYANKANIFLVTEIETVISDGPTAGICCDYNMYHQTMDDLADHRKYISEDDRMLMVGGWLMDSMEYLFSGAEICNPSTIDTPLYNENTVLYFELYPEKNPSVVAVYCPYGTLMVDMNTPVMKWVEENYSVCDEGQYWRYYR